MVRTLCLSGWGQPHDALASLLPEARHLEYASHDSVPDALTAIARHGAAHDVVVGWSLGGQLAVRAIAAGMMKPKALVLLAAPYQFVEADSLKLGMKRDTFEKFRNNFRTNPRRTLDKSWELVVMDDARADEIRQHLARHDKDKVLKNDWLKWLLMLDGFSCKDLHLADFPPTLLVHGERDVVVAVDQSQHFARAIPHATLVNWKNCGHAPHWHDGSTLRKLIAGHAHV